MEIVIDDRERVVVPFLEDASHKYHLNYRIQRNEVGDYAIVYKGHILMIIERKTWVDLASSFRDGRKGNIVKLIGLREQTGCQIAYLIEGNATPAFSAKYGRLPIRNLRAHLDHLAIRDGVHMLYSKDAEYTAERLFELATNYLTVDEIIKEIKDVDDNDTKLKEKSECKVSINEVLLRHLPSVGSILSGVLSENCVTVSTIYKDVHDAEFIAGLKYSSGAVIGLPKAKKIIAGTKKLIDDDSPSKKQIKFLAEIPGISIKASEKILEQTSLHNLMNNLISIDELTQIYRSEKTKISVKLAENIFQYLNIET